MIAASATSGSPLNRLAAVSGRGGIAVMVTVLVDAIARRERWVIARYATGDLLGDLLGSDRAEVFGGPLGIGESAGLSDPAPVVMVDDGMALVVGTVGGSRLPAPVPVTALLVQSETGGRWFVAALTHDRITDPDFARRVQYRSFGESADLAIIVRHSPLDREAAAVDWDDACAVIGDPGNPVVTAGDAIAEAHSWDRSAWHWLADIAEGCRVQRLPGCGRGSRRRWSCGRAVVPR